MRQREIERIEKGNLWACRLSNKFPVFLREFMRQPNENCRNADRTCITDGRKCDAVKFQLKEVKDETLG